MAEKLKSILRRIRLSLALKAASFAAAWLILPFWAFILVASYLYFVPVFQSLKFAWPFLILIFFALIETPNIWFAVFFGVLFYLILGIKDLLFINRKSAYETLILLLLFLMSMRFFARFDSWGNWTGFFWAFIISAMFFFLCGGFLGFGVSPDGKEFTPRSLETAALGSFLLWQFLIATLFLPLNFLYQSALFFIVATILSETLFDYVSRELWRNRLLRNFSILLSFLAVTLGSAHWGL